MKIRTTLVSIASCILFASAAFAGTIDFENMPQSYWYYGGQQNFGNYWAGATIGPNSTILEDQVYGYNSSGYPPHSGHAVLFSYSNPSIDFTFNSPIDTFSFWYTAYYDFTISAYDSSNNFLNSDVLPNNYGTNSFYSWSTGSSIIKSISMTGTGNYFTIDDFTAPIVTGRPTAATPEPGTILLMGIGVAGAVIARRRMNKGGM